MGQRDGTWHLLWGDADAAIDELRAAAQAEPNNARVQSDLAAAFLARAGRAEDPQSILDAHTAPDSAIALNGTLPEVRFNRHSRGRLASIGSRRYSLGG